MRHETFKASILSALFTPVFFAVVFLIIYLVNGNLPLFAWLIFALPLILTVSKLKEKLEIENDILRYKRLFKTKEIPLAKVTKIIQTSVSSTDSDNKTSVKFVINALDESGRIYLSFPSYLLSNKTEARFREAVNRANPTIKIEF